VVAEVTPNILLNGLCLLGIAKLVVKGVRQFLHNFDGFGVVKVMGIGIVVGVGFSILPLGSIVSFFIGPGKTDGTCTAWSLDNLLVCFTLEISVLCHVLIQHLNRIYVAVI
jgi:hypothetical protein